MTKLTRSPPAMPRIQIPPSVKPVRRRREHKRNCRKEQGLFKNSLNLLFDSRTRASPLRMGSGSDRFCLRARSARSQQRGLQGMHVLARPAPRIGGVARLISRITGLIGLVVAIAVLLPSAASAADPVIAAAGDIACSFDHEGDRSLSPQGDLGPARERRALGGADPGRRAVRERRALEVHEQLRPDLGKGEVDHPSLARQPRVQDLGRGGLLRLLQRDRAVRPAGPAIAARATTASTSAPGT